MRQIGRESFDGCNLLVGGAGNRSYAGAHCLSFNVHRAGAALRHAAAIFGSGKSQVVTQDPEKRGSRINIHIDAPLIDGKGNHLKDLLTAKLYRWLVGLRVNDRLCGKNSSEKDYLSCRFVARHSESLYRNPVLIGEPVPTAGGRFQPP